MAVKMQPRAAAVLAVAAAALTLLQAALSLSTMAALHRSHGPPAASPTRRSGGRNTRRGTDSLSPRGRVRLAREAARGPSKPKAC